MESTLSPYDLAALRVLARVRGMQPEVACKYAVLREAKTLDATRKRFERLTSKGLLATSKLSAGSQMFRLSKQGVKVTGAPPSFADAPTQAVCYDMIASAACGWRANDFVFLTRSEFLALIEQLSPDSKLAKPHGRFLLRPFGTTTPETTHQ